MLALPVRDRWFALRVCHDAPKRGFELRVREFESGFDEPGWENPSALEDEFGLGADDERAQFGHPPEGGKTEGNAENLADGAHECAVVARVGGRCVHYSVEFGSCDEEFDDA